MFTHFSSCPPPPSPQNNVGKTTIDLIQILNTYQHCVWEEAKFCSESFKMSICLQIFLHDCSMGRGVFHPAPPLPPTTPLSLKLES